MESKDTFFSEKQSLNISGELRGFERPLIMGIMNITPDSFYQGSRVSEPAAIEEYAMRLGKEGADIIDVGAYSSRPGAADVSTEEELKRLSIALPIIRSACPEVPISVDTFRSGIARTVVEDFGISMINDISAGELDPDMFSVIAELQVPYTIMHMRGKPAHMQKHAVYEDVVKEVLEYLSSKVMQLNAMGVRDIIIDPGFGFAKTIDHNYELLGRLEAFRVFRQPLMVGLSRKSMVYRVLDCEPAGAQNGSTVLHTIALMKGANILRVHDVREAREAVILTGMATGTTGNPGNQQR